MKKIGGSINQLLSDPSRIELRETSAGRETWVFNLFVRVVCLLVVWVFDCLITAQCSRIT